ncbi:MAG: hypothetical protein IJ774_14935 [Selenomonadaceae bacterium]|nr:hypothetical protein [Selenomonadaceae bacterium]
MIRQIYRHVNRKLLRRISRSTKSTVTATNFTVDEFNGYGDELHGQRTQRSQRRTSRSTNSAVTAANFTVNELNGHGDEFHASTNSTVTAANFTVNDKKLSTNH